ncbi:MAG: efflux RND transporter periplasmic adaptor subunit [Alphaproteobacteria bacterium]|jgi:Cu(I)/Ag(I) efflux system membrane fusion protein|nr:efflux RND transporter periplasmic adaptor subunit [Alphaproteobacteria bacterium]
MRGRYGALACLALVAGLGGGIAVERLFLAAPAADEDGGPRILYWVAPMDPNFRRDGPGLSPMGMELVPVYEGEEQGDDPSEVALSPVEINAIGVRTAVARVETLTPRVETVGFVGYDEHRTSHIHMRTEGWIEDLRVRAVGDPVREGQLLFKIYAPEIVVAISEYRRGLRRNDRLQIDAALGQMRNLGVSERQIEELTANPDASDRLRVYAPQDGVVVDLPAAEGMYLRPENRAMTLTDLSSVWLLVDVFERDIGRLSADMRAQARLDHLPGHTFAGAVDYVYPELDPQTRTLPVRLRFDNAEALLRPNMFAEVTLLGEGGREAVTVPAEAVIRTGRAERVVLALPEGRFKPRLITTGLMEEGRVEIVQGLAAGERVVVSAQFLIDSESSLAAGFLRMAPTDAEPAPGRGRLVEIDPESRRATIAHAQIEALDWPAMTTDFAIAAAVALDRLAPGADVRFEAVRGADGLLALTTLQPDDGVDAVGTGTIHAVMRADRKVSLSHDPIDALGWPAMTMDLPFADTVESHAIPLETPVEFDLARGEGAMYVITAIRPQETANEAGPGEESGAGAMTSPGEAAGSSGEESVPILVGGVVNAVDAEARTATITHDDIAAIGMPGMTMEFPLAATVDPVAVPLRQRVEIGLRRSGGMRLEVVSIEPETGSVGQ